MGLDMFLHRQQYAFGGMTGTLRMYGKDKPKRLITDQPVLVKEQVGYWRKANQIHNWFVVNVQDGVDNCAEYSVEHDQLVELLRVCREVVAASTLIPGRVSVGQTLEEGEWKDILEDGLVIEDPTVAKQLLPVQEGFFFGSYDYDEDYISQVRETISILEKALVSRDDVWFTYQSSW